MGWLEQWDERNARTLQQHNEKFGGERGQRRIDRRLSAIGALCVGDFALRAIGQAAGYPAGAVLWVTGWVGMVWLVVRWVRTGEAADSD